MLRGPVRTHAALIFCWHTRFSGIFPHNFLATRRTGITRVCATRIKSKHHIDKDGLLFCMIQQDIKKTLNGVNGSHTLNDVGRLVLGTHRWQARLAFVFFCRARKHVDVKSGGDVKKQYSTLSAHRKQTCV